MKKHFQSNHKVGFMKNLFKILIPFFLFTFLFCKKYDFVCINEENNFQQVFNIDDYNKTISWKYSIDLDRDETYIQDLSNFPDLIWNFKEGVVSYFYETYQGGYYSSNIQWFDLKNNTMILFSFNPKGFLDNQDLLVWEQYYDCYKIPN